MTRRPSPIVEARQAARMNERRARTAARLAQLQAAAPTADADDLRALALHTSDYLLPCILRVLSTNLPK